MCGNRKNSRKRLPLQAWRLSNDVRSSLQSCFCVVDDYRGRYDQYLVSGYHHGALPLCVKGMAGIINARLQR